MKNYKELYWPKRFKTYMQPEMEQKGNILFVSFLLTSFLFLVEISFFILCNKAYLTDFSHVASNIKIPITIIPGIVYFILAQIFVHISFALLIVVFSMCIIRFFSIKNSYADKLAITIWILAVLVVLLANQLYFPYSKFSELLNVLLPLFVTKIVFYLLCLCFLIMAGIVLLYGIQQLLQHDIKILFVISSCVFLFVSYFVYLWHKHQINKINLTPNIIFIGIDSLRPDFLSYFGGDVSTQTLDEFLSHSVVFSNAFTPLARTFPSWTGILTGMYPVHNGVRFNLTSPSLFNFQMTLPEILKQKGYQTVFATDETRFSNIDQRFGFDRIITPPIGLNDFLIGTFNDFPLSNLLINSKLGEYLFPNSFGNRPAYITYNPKSFIQLIKEHLNPNHAAPTFLAVHFCLPHFPYLWQQTSRDATTAIEFYSDAVTAVDQQVRDFLTLIRKKGYLENAVVVLFSDHGEGIELDGDRATEENLYLSKIKKASPHFYPESLDHETINQSLGHGTDVLGLPQYHSLLAFQFFGQTNYKPATFNDLVSLLDIAPTILNLLHIKKSFDGQTLLPLIKGEVKTLSKRHMILESDFTPTAIRTVFPKTRQVMLEGVRLFEIDPVNTRLTVRKDMGQMIIDSKQLADIYGEWMLAFYPQENKKYVPILINLNTGVWTDDLTTQFAQLSPAKDMSSVLQNFYHIKFSN